MTATRDDRTLDYFTLGHSQATYAVIRTSASTLEPVTLAVTSAPLSFHDYLTADDADLLGDALKAMAAQVRAKP